MPEQNVSTSRLTVPLIQFCGMVVIVVGAGFWIKDSIHSLENRIMEDKLQAIEEKSKDDRAMSERFSDLQSGIQDLRRQVAGFESRATNAVSRMELRALFQLLDEKNDGKISVPEVK